MVRYLLFFALIFNQCYAQKIAIKNDRNEPIAGVSVFLTSKNNTLIAISDSFGNAAVDIKNEATYLFHLLGHTDLKLTAQQLRSNPNVTLQSAQYHLNELNVKRSKYKNLKLVNRPGKFSFGAENSIRATFQNVTPIEIKHPGFLREFKLFAFQQIKGPTRKFRLVIFKAADGKPDEPLTFQITQGVLKGSRLIFDLATKSPFLEKGTYFIGYESVNDPAEFYGNAVSAADRAKMYPYVMIKGKEVNEPKMFTRWNLAEWKPIRITIPNQGKFIEMAFELEMDVIN